MAALKTWKEAVLLARPLHTNGAYNTEFTKSQIHDIIDHSKDYLNKREREVLHALVSLQGVRSGQLNPSNKKLGEILECSESTVKRYLYNIFKKFPTSIVPIFYWKGFTQRRQILIDWDAVYDIIRGKIPYNHGKTLVNTYNITSLREAQQAQKRRKSEPVGRTKLSNRNDSTRPSRDVQKNLLYDGQNDTVIFLVLNVIEEIKKLKNHVLNNKTISTNEYEVISYQNTNYKNIRMENISCNHTKVSTEDVFDIFIADNLSIITDDMSNNLLNDQEEFYMGNYKDYESDFFRIIESENHPEEIVHRPKNFRLPDTRKIKKTFDEISSLSGSPAPRKELPRQKTERRLQNKTRPAIDLRASDPRVRKIMEQEGITIGELSRRMALNPEYNPLDNPEQKFYEDCHSGYSHLPSNIRNGLFNAVAETFFKFRKWSKKEPATLKRARKLADKHRADYYEWIASQYYFYGKDLTVWQLEGPQAEKNYLEAEKENLYLPPPPSGKFSKDSEQGGKSFSLSLFEPSKTNARRNRREAYYNRVYEKRLSESGCMIDEEGNIIGGDE
jgi:DNA-binding CsgD family transcriptional regulator